MKAEVIVTSTNKGQLELLKSIGLLTKTKILVGIPATTAAERQADLLKLLYKTKGKKKRKQITASILSTVNNAELLYIFSHGSPLKHIPARPVLEAALEDEVNQKLLMEPLLKAAQAALDGKEKQVELWLGRAGQLAENLCKAWFTNPKNGWAPNALSTIRRKGSSVAGIDTGEMRKSITHILTEEK